MPSSDAGNRGNSPCEEWISITPSDINVLSPAPRGIFCNVAGNIALIDVYGNSVIFTVAASVIYPFRPVKILSTGTTATDIIGLY